MNELHIGITLKEVLDDRKISVADFAFKVNETESYINSIINGTTPILSDFAHKLEKELKINKRFWLNLQSIYDERKELENRKGNNNNG